MHDKSKNDKSNDINVSFSDYLVFKKLKNGNHKMLQYSQYITKYKLVTVTNTPV